MPLKVSIALDVPIRFKRITNGERVIEQTGPDENEIDVREDETEGGSRFEMLIRLLDEAERELRGRRARKRDYRKSSNPVVP
mgnify:FL=1